MSEIKSHRQELEEKIADLSQKLEQLRAELRQEREQEQHEAIDRLEEYMDDANISMVGLRRFWRQMMKEVRKKN